MNLRAACAALLLLSTPAHAFVEVGVASWYGRHSADKETASGTPFNPDGFTAAHRTLPLGSCVRVTNLRNHLSVRVVIRDRGPHVRGRLIDLSEAAAAAIGMKHKGVTRVRIRLVRCRHHDADR